ncbi:MAG: ornithine carbamoyltransferase [Herpetosiphonaceae bacterium]|nr:ornithine carbamoyltransferase [Herpetosiphonaceae bacterium]
MHHRHYLSVTDFSAEETYTLLALAARLKHKWHKHQRPSKRLKGQTLAAIFEKPSLRTRTTLEVAMTQLGGHTVVLGDSIGLGVREPAMDVAHNLARWVQIIAARTFAHATLEELARYSAVPVINTLSDREHPCQALADMLTLQEHWGELPGHKLAFVGDGNNVAHSLLLLGAMLGLSVAVATPAEYAPDPLVVQRAEACAAQHGSNIVITTDPQIAVAEADAIYTDVWVSMGQEAETATRQSIFAPYQVSQALWARTGNNQTLIMHDLPAHRGEEISAELLDGPHSVIYDQAENRLHVQKALILTLLERT